jgi:hypothetical protein
VKSYRIFSVLLLGGSLIACNRAPRVVSPSNCEIRNVSVAASRWVFSETVDAMDGRKTSVASLHSLVGDVIIRCRGAELQRDLLCRRGKMDAYVATDNIVDDQSPSVRVRFDGGQPIRETWSRSADYKGMFASNPRQFMAEIMKSNKFLIEYSPYQRTPQTLDFDVGGLSESVAGLEVNAFLRALKREDVIKACGSGFEETPGNARVQLSYLPVGSKNIGLEFEFSTYGGDAGKLISIKPIGGQEITKNALTWYGSGIGDDSNQREALNLIKSSPGLAALWNASQGVSKTN